MAAFFLNRHGLIVASPENLQNVMAITPFLAGFWQGVDR
jgi:hypothetical protein